MTLNPSNSSSLEQLALKGLIEGIGSTVSPQIQNKRSSATAEIARVVVPCQKLDSLGYIFMSDSVEDILVK